jgi:hypothetical protein
MARQNAHKPNLLTLKRVKHKTQQNKNEHGTQATTEEGHTMGSYQV